MQDQHKKNAKLIAGIILIAVAALSAISYFMPQLGIGKSFVASYFIPIKGGYALVGIALGLFMENTLVIAFASLVGAIHNIIILVDSIGINISYYIGIAYLDYIGLIVMFGFLAISMLLPKVRREMGIVSEIGVAAIIVYIISLIIEFATNPSFSPYLTSILPPNLLGIGFAAAVMIAIWNIMLVFAEDMPIKNPQAANQAGATQAAVLDNKVEQLIKLKELLDVGAITQEEFEAKKKELL